MKKQLLFYHVFKKYMCMLTFILAFTIKLQAQQSTSVVGVVRNNADAVLSGVSVTAKNTSSNFSSGAATDENGIFKFAALPEGIYDFTFNLIGYQSKTLSGYSIKTGKTVNILLKLSPGEIMLSDVVIVGYGTQRKITLTGSVETIRPDRIINKPVPSLADALAGEASGLTVTQSGSQPGVANSSFRVRGIGTWGNSNPLVLVDGIEMSMNDIAPNDVASVTVLKDAAAAIYGSRAANGVILVTTKQGGAGKISMSYSGNVGLQVATRLPEPVTSWQYAEMVNQVTKNITGNPGTTYSPEKIARMKAGGNPDVLEGSTNWYDELINNAVQNNHNVTIQGTGEKTSYFASLGYLNQNGVINSSYERYNLRLNTSTAINNWFKIGVNFNYVNDNRLQSAAGAAAAYYYVPRSLPQYPVKFSNGVWSFLSAPHNAVRRASYDYGTQNLKNDRIAVLLSPEITPIKGLLVKGTLGYESATPFIKTHTRIVTYDAFAPANQNTNTIVARNRLMDDYAQQKDLTAILTATYDLKLYKHAFKMMAGASAESFKYNQLDAYRMDLANNELTEIDAGDVSTSNASGYSTYQSLVSGFSRLNYSFNEKYLFEVGFRYDGSSKFAKDHQWGAYPSLSAGWRISQESFFSGLKKHIQELKFRGSWGKMGNNRISNYLTYSTYSPGFSYNFDNGLTSSYSENILGNPLLTWETATMKNIAMEATLLNKLDFSFELYEKVTDNILLDLEFPSTLGIAAPIQNAGSIKNRGWDFSMNWRDKIGEDFNYHIGFNLSDVTNKITNLNGYKSPTDNLTIRIEGQPLDALYGWQTLGLATTPALFEKYKDVMRAFSPNWNLGDIIVKDRNGDGEINGGDKTIIGNPIPRYTFGLNLGGTFKKVDFSIFFQGVGKRDSFMGRDIIEPMGIFSALKEHFNESFNPGQPNLQAHYPRLLGAAQRHNWQNFSHWVQNAAYLRLKNVSLGYTLEIPQAKIQSIRVAFSAQNLLTFTKFRTFDPENAVDSISFPNVAVYSFGLSLTF